MACYYRDMGNLWPSMEEQRQWMIDTIRNEARLCAGYTGRPELSARVLEMMTGIPRHRFMPLSMRISAYDNAALPIGHGQTISQPFIVALMTDLLDLTGKEKVLEIGTGTGYQTAVLSQLAADIYSVEYLPELLNSAGQRLTKLSYNNVHLRHGDGWLGWPEHAPYDAIIVTAAPERIPPALLEQLASRAAG